MNSFIHFLDKIKINLHTVYKFREILYFQKKNMATKVSVQLRSSTFKQLGNTAYKETDGFQNGTLPTNKQIVENMIYLLRTNRAGQAQRSREDAALILAEILEDHWNFCNIYTIRTKNILSKILNLYNEFTKLVQVREIKKRENLPGKSGKF